MTLFLADLNGQRITIARLVADLESARKTRDDDVRAAVELWRENAAPGLPKPAAIAAASGLSVRRVHELAPARRGVDAIHVACEQLVADQITLAQGIEHQAAFYRAHPDAPLPGESLPADWE